MESPISVAETEMAITAPIPGAESSHSTARDPGIQTPVITDRTETRTTVVSRPNTVPDREIILRSPETVRLQTPDHDPGQHVMDVGDQVRTRVRTQFHSARDIGQDHVRDHGIMAVPPFQDRQETMDEGQIRSTAGGEELQMLGEGDPVRSQVFLVFTRVAVPEITRIGSLVGFTPTTADEASGGGGGGGTTEGGHTVCRGGRDRSRTRDDRVRSVPREIQTTLPHPEEFEDQSTNLSAEGFRGAVCEGPLHDDLTIHPSSSSSDAALRSRLLLLLQGGGMTLLETVPVPSCLRTTTTTTTATGCRFPLLLLLLLLLLMLRVHLCLVESDLRDEGR